MRMWGVPACVCVPVCARICVRAKVRVCARARVCACVLAIGRLSRASATGITWMSRTLKAGWAVRDGHTSVIDAVSGAIYVIGGKGGLIAYFQDVWASTDGGARAGLGEEGGRGVDEGGGSGWGTPLRGTQGVLRGTTGYLGVPRGYQGYYRGYQGVLRGTKRVLGRY
jgi:hypothetical protein